MAKKLTQSAPRSTSGTKGRGRTRIHAPSTGPDLGPTPTRPNVPVTMKTQASRPAGGGAKHRGDRRDMHRQYTGTTPHAARGKTGRLDRSTRKD